MIDIEFNDPKTGTLFNPIVIGLFTNVIYRNVSTCHLSVKTDNVLHMHIAKSEIKTFVCCICYEYNTIKNRFKLFTGYS